MSKRDVELVYQSLLSEHHGNPDLALRDLAYRFVYVMRGVSPGYMRFPPDDPVKDARPVVEPVDDGSWIKTALGDA
jgi:hypothetical protein